MEYATLSARLATFDPPTKRSKSGWPHTTPTAKDTAQAGFYHHPQGAGSDNVICYLCERALDGWEADDDPVQEHLKHSPECGWAVLLNVNSQTSYDTSNMDDPTNTSLSEARRATFAIGWPHESKRGWSCKVEKMVEAGWYFAPTSESEDFVSCSYCKLSLDGWEPKDNPFDEHYRRSPDCPFFVFAGTTAPSKRPKAKKSRASRASRSSKVSTRLSTQSNLSIMSEAPSIPDLDESIDSSSVSVLSTMSTASTATNKGKRKAAGGKSKAAKPKKAKTTRSTRGKKAEPEAEGEIETMASSEAPPDSGCEESKPTLSPGVEVEISNSDTYEITPIPIPPRSPARLGPVRNTPELPKSPVQSSPAQHSDIENAPPSTRPPSDRPPLSSPGEVGPTWTPVDVELVFQSVPGSRLWDEGDASLSTEEAGMTVQEWIEHIATKAEAELRAEGEKMVGIFEQEGARAMTVLERIVCV